MIKAAIDAHAPLQGASISIYAKGSYANNTNVRLDSDVDIVVECTGCVFYDFAHWLPTAPAKPLAPYSGKWTTSLWRSEVTAAIVNYFGAAEVDSSGTTAITVAERPGSRPSADVVPSFCYRRYLETDGSRWDEGSCVYKADGTRIINWPEQQLSNGRTRNQATGQRYKNFVRALKNAENFLVDGKMITPKPSYLMECLVWNAADAKLRTGSLDEGFRDTLLDLWGSLEGEEHKQWVEPNKIKYLFHPSQKWSTADALGVVTQAYKLVYG